MALIQAKPFRLALLQLAGLSGNKASNIAVARKAVATAAASVPKPDLIVLPEIWNSPYAVTAFREYSEPVPNVKSGKEVPNSATEGETVTAMREMARAAGTYLIGGEWVCGEGTPRHCYSWPEPSFAPADANCRDHSRARGADGCHLQHTHRL